MYKPKVSIDHWDLPRASKEYAKLHNEALIKRLQESLEDYRMRLLEGVRTKINKMLPVVRTSWGEGYDSRLVGLTEDCCPYGEDAKEDAKEWLNGWDTAGTEQALVG